MKNIKIEDKKEEIKSTDQDRVIHEMMLKLHEFPVTPCLKHSQQKKFDRNCHECSMSTTISFVMSQVVDHEIRVRTLENKKAILT